MSRGGSSLKGKARTTQKAGRRGSHSQDTPRWDVLGLGCVAVDDLLLAPNYPTPDSKVRLLGRQRSSGGLTATALIAAARLGARAAFAGVLGDDDDSRFVLDSFQREGVDVSCAVRRPDARPIHST